MENENRYKILSIILLIVLVSFWVRYKDSKREKEVLTNLIDEYQYALEQANENIDEANSIIEDAQGYAWSSYEEMGDVLDNLTTIDNVLEP